MKNLLGEFIKCFYPPAIVFLLFNWFIGGYFGLYIIWPLYDIPVHFLGGVSMGITGYMLLKFCEKQNWIRLPNKFIFLILIFCYVSLTATLWEFYEFLADHYLETLNQPSISDTMGDMFLGLMGGIMSGSLMISLTCSYKPPPQK